MRESRLLVTVDANEIRVAGPFRPERSISWRALERLLIRTTDEGPFVADVFWEIEPIEEPVLTFPDGAEGTAEFLHAAQQQLDGFRNDQVVAAMSSTSNRELVVWEHDRVCARCGNTLPELGLTHEQRLDLRRIIDASGPIHGIKRLRELAGCDLRTAKLWVDHRGIAGRGHAPPAPCPHCGEPLRTPQARQCRFCKRDWHDPAT